VTEAERHTLRALDTPARIQAFLDETPYSTDPFYRSPLRVLRDRRAHCVDGALFAASALRALGQAPQVVDLQAVRDDDHVLAVFQVDGHWGAVAKSNTVGLRFREPVYRTLRELAMSYFEVYFNLEAEKSLRAYSDALDLSEYDDLGWETDDTHLEDVVVARLYRLRHRPLLTAAMVARLEPVDRRSFDGNLLGADWDGLWKNPQASSDG
jgi:hypothetical protein